MSIHAKDEQVPIKPGPKTLISWEAPPISGAKNLPMETVLLPKPMTKPMSFFLAMSKVILVAATLVTLFTMQYGIWNNSCRNMSGNMVRSAIDNPWIIDMWRRSLLSFPQYLAIMGPTRKPVDVETTPENDISRLAVNAVCTDVGSWRWINTAKDIRNLINNTFQTCFKKRSVKYWRKTENGLHDLLSDRTGLSSSRKIVIRTVEY